MLRTSILSAVCVFSSLAISAQDHGHLNVGAVSQTQGAKLTFDNGVDFLGAYVKTLTFTNSGKYANLYQGNITLTALHSVDPFGEPIPTAPAPGAFITAVIVSVEGPEGGAFQFWESTSTTEPTISIESGMSNVGFRFEVSESALGAGQPGGDPYGHIHGRRFTITKPGLYIVTFRAFDTSQNGPGGGPIHVPSDPISIQIQGGVNLTAIDLNEDHVRLSFGALVGYSWRVQSKDSLTAPTWTDIGDSVIGNDLIVEVLDHRQFVPSRIYQAIGTAIEL